MSVKQTARIISTYAGDTSGVASALFELGGMTVMHDASGCNSTYNTHDEPRWYDRDSLVFISALSETEAILGDDRKLTDDVVRTAGELNPVFIALAGTPIPMMTGVDLAAVAREIEAETGIPAFGFDTDGMHAYNVGASKALAAIAERFVREPDGRSGALSVNLLGLTPLDFSLTGAENSMRRVLGEHGIDVISAWAMGSSLDELAQAARARVNLVVSSAGLGAARVMRERFGIPYVIGTPCGKRFNDVIAQAVRRAAEDGNDRSPASPEPFANRVIIGEPVTASSLAAALTLESGVPYRAVSAVDTEEELIRPGCPEAIDEDDILPLLEGADVIVADPLYRPICPASARFVPLPHEGFSGRIYRKDIPDLVPDINKFRKEQEL